MPKIVAWKSKYTGQIFERYCDYRKHLKKLARSRAAERKKAAEWKRLDAVAVNMRNTVKTFDELREYVLAHGDDFIARARRVSWKHNDDPRAWKNLKLTSFKFDRLSWSESVSNSHRCPIGGVTNWCGTNDKLGYPKGYPGWHGNVSGTMNFWWSIGGSDLLDGTGINTGSGGGGEKWSYTLEIFAADFPALTENYLRNTEVGLNCLMQFKKLHPTFMPAFIDERIRSFQWTIHDYHAFKDIFPEAAEEQAARLGWEILANPTKVKA